MRPPPAVLVALLAATVLAGCTDPPVAEATPVEAAPEPALEAHGFEASVFARSRPGCTVAVCSGGGYPTTIYQSPDEASIRSLSLDIAKVEFEDRPVEWRLTCVAPDDEDPGCLRALGHGHDPLPVHVDLPVLDLAPGTGVLLELIIPPIVTPVVDSFAMIARGPTEVRGTVQLASIGNATSPPARVRETLPVSFEGHSGPCVIAVEAGCSRWPGGTRHIVDGVEGTVVAASLTMTWNAVSPADEVLELSVGPYSCAATCPPAVSAAGRSPLVVDLPSLDLRGSVALSVYHGDPTGLDPTGWAFRYFGTRTPIQVEGALTVERPPAETEG